MGGRREEPTVVLCLGEDPRPDFRMSARAKPISRVPADSLIHDCPAGSTDGSDRNRIALRVGATRDRRFRCTPAMAQHKTRLNGTAERREPTVVFLLGGGSSPELPNVRTSKNRSVRVFHSTVAAFPRSLLLRCLAARLRARTVWISDSFGFN